MWVIHCFYFTVERALVEFSLLCSSCFLFLFNSNSQHNVGGTSGSPFPFLILLSLSPTIILCALLLRHFSRQSHVELLINSLFLLFFSLSPPDPPSVKCKNFTEKYGIEGVAFPCYYSRKNKTVVMTSFSRETQVNTIIHFFVVPFIVTILSSIGICMIHCSCSCKKERPKYRRPRVDNIRWALGWQFRVFIDRIIEFCPKI